MGAAEKRKRPVLDRDEVFTAPNYLFNPPTSTDSNTSRSLAFQTFLKPSEIARDRGLG